MLEGRQDEARRSQDEASSQAEASKKWREAAAPREPTR
mgnify:CR=1 FL=1